jgi:DNA-binding NtrC family response regulator
MNEIETNILIVEDDSLTLQTTKRLLKPYGKVITASSEEDTYKLIQEHQIDIAFFDLNLNGEMSGLKLLTYARLNGIYSIVISGEAQTSILEEAFTNGAKDYLIKPFTQEKLSAVISRFYNNNKHIEFEKLIDTNFITKSPELSQELYKIKNLSVSDRPIFIHGETGTGKRVVAHLIQKILGLENFLEINCSQFTDELFASELFGHRKGSFTGAIEDRVGFLEQANNGVIFLDEIHALSIKSQKTLLKAIEEKEFYPVGSKEKVKSNFRVISATCEDIELLIDQSLFRADLYARINTFNIELSPLRKRKEDIVLLLEHFISKQLMQIVITKEAKELLTNYTWPRNTREIQDIVENWVVHGHRLITQATLPPHIVSNIVLGNKLVNDYHLDLAEEIGISNLVILLKKEIIEIMIKRYNGNAKDASNAMQASPPNISRFMITNKDKQIINGVYVEKK